MARTIVSVLFVLIFAAPAPAREAVVIGIPPQVTNLVLVPQWRDVLARFDADRQACSIAGCDSWSALLASVAGLGPMDQVAEINRRLNALPYVSDIRNWQSPDYWETPAEFMARGGDCEDYAIAKYLALRAVGVPATAMRIVVLWDRRVRVFHAVLMVEMAGDRVILDNNLVGIATVGDIHGYRPIYSINENGLWLHATLRELAR